MYELWEAGYRILRRFPIIAHRFPVAMMSLPATKQVVRTSESDRTRFTVLPYYRSPTSGLHDVTCGLHTAMNSNPNVHEAHVMQAMTKATSPVAACRPPAGMLHARNDAWRVALSDAQRTSIDLPIGQLDYTWPIYGWSSNTTMGLSVTVQPLLMGENLADQC